MNQDQTGRPVSQQESVAAGEPESAAGNSLICPVCGEIAVPEKCKVICRSAKCRGRVIYNCSEF